MSIKILALSREPFEEDYHYYAGFLNEVTNAIPAGGEVDAKASDGKMVNGLHFKAIEVAINDQPEMSKGVWIVVPQAALTQNHIDAWLLEMRDDATSKGVLGIAPGESLVRSNDYGFSYKSPMPLELFNMLIGEGEK